MKSLCALDDQENPGMNAASAAFSAIRTPPSSPISASTPCSTGGRNARGIVVSDGTRVAIHKAMGLVSEVFSEESLQRLTGHMAVGHVRYSTTGDSNIVNTQPFMVHHQGTPLAVAHNGLILLSHGSDPSWPLQLCVFLAKACYLLFSQIEEWRTI